MSVLLTVNIGNTRVALGTFDCSAPGELLQPKATTAVPVPDAGPFLLDFEPPESIDAAVFASVNPPCERPVIDWIAERFGVRPVRFPADAPPLMENRCQPPEAVGADRLANAVAAVGEFKSDCLIVDAGTAVTVDAVSAAGPVFLGGAILPGVRLAAHALAKGSALLPHVAVREPGPAVATSTAAAISSGVARGLAGAVDRLVSDMAGELGSGQCILLTGGDAPRFERLCKAPMQDRPHLTLRGLALAWLARAGT